MAFKKLNSQEKLTLYNLLLGHRKKIAKSIGFHQNTITNNLKHQDQENLAVINSCIEYISNYTYELDTRSEEIKKFIESLIE